MIDRKTVSAVVIVLALLASIAIWGVGGEAGAFWQVPALVLVIGGTILTTCIACPGARPSSLLQLFKKAFARRDDSAESTIIAVVALAGIARRDGLLALEKPVASLKEGFLRRAMQMAIDGNDSRTIEAVMQTEIQSTDLRHTYGNRVLESMGRFAPAFGMIGTLIGLVVMLGRMDDPTKIGPGMAVALLTTLYGLVLANVFCFPLSRRLAHQNSEELLHKTIMLQGALAIHAGDHPRIVAQKLRAYLPIGGHEHGSIYDSLVKRVSYGDAMSARQTMEAMVQRRSGGSAPAGINTGSGEARPGEVGKKKRSFVGVA